MIVFRLSNILQDFQMTQKELAEKTGIRAATINEIYHGQTKRLNIENLNKICEELNCTTEDILEYIPDKEYYKYYKKNHN